MHDLYQKFKRSIHPFELEFIILCLIAVAFECLYLSYVVSTKGDVYSTNFESYEHVRYIRSEGFWSFIEHIYNNPLSKAITISLVQLPLFFTGLSSILINKIYILAFNFIFYTTLYGVFRFTLTPWLSMIAALAMGIPTAILWDMHQFDIYLFIASCLPAAYFFIQRYNEAIGNQKINFFAVSFFIFLFTTNRVFDAFFLFIVVGIFNWRILFLRPVITGLVLSGLWCLFQAKAIVGYWYDAKVVVKAGQFAWNYYELKGHMYQWIFALGLVSLFSRSGREAFTWRSSLAMLLFPVILLTALVAIEFTSNDYLMSSRIMLMFVFLRAILYSELKNPLRWKTTLIFILVGTFYVDQTLRFTTEEDLFMEGTIARHRSELKTRKLWQKMRPYFQKDKNYVVVSLYTINTDPVLVVRPIWGFLQTYVFDEDLRDNVDFIFPNDYIKAEDVDKSYFCERKITHLLVYKDGNHFKNTDLVNDYVVDRHRFPYEIITSSKLLETLSFAARIVDIYHREEIEFRELSCP